MARFSLNQLSQENRIQLIAEFYDTIASLQGREEVHLFFQDLLTPDEIAMLMRRVEVAVLLRGGFTYEQISELLGVGRDKITNVQRSIGRHSGGYEVAITRLLERRKTKVKIKRGHGKTKFSEYERLKRNPLSGLYLFHIVDQIADLLESKTGKVSRKVDEEVFLKTPSARKTS